MRWCVWRTKAGGPRPLLAFVNLSLTYYIYGGHRDFDVEARFTRLPKDFDSYRFATGVINVKNSAEHLDGNVRGCWGTDWPTGKDDGVHKLETVGLGILIPNACLDHQEAINPQELTSVVKPIREGNEAVLRYKLAYTSANEDFGFGSSKAWFEWLDNWKNTYKQGIVVGITQLQ